MHAELVRVALHEVDIKIVSGERMHVLARALHYLLWWCHVVVLRAGVSGGVSGAGEGW